GRLPLYRCTAMLLNLLNALPADASARALADARRVSRGHRLCAVRVLSTIGQFADQDRKSTRLNSSHVSISYAVFCLKKKNIQLHLSFPVIVAGADYLVQERDQDGLTPNLLTLLKVTHGARRLRETVSSYMIAICTVA